MRIDEIKAASAAERRVKALRANAEREGERAKQLKARADVSAEQLEMQRSRQKLGQSMQSAVTSTIKPYC